MPKISEQDVQPPEHPDDRDLRLRSEAYGKSYAAEFCRDHAADMRLLIETYPDRAAAELLDKLREMFWAKLWTPKGTS